jgi:hypothetical protein
MPSPFSIHVPDEVLVDLRSRLGAVRLPSGVTGSGGVPLDEATAFLDRWRTGFDWRRQEAWLNSFDHFRESLGGLQVHFLHHRSTHPSATPLLLLHGWPGSFVEMLDILPILARTFHVVVPSLPGYGFSDAPSEPGWSNARMADLFADLMHRLSADRFACTAATGAPASRPGWRGRSRTASPRSISTTSPDPSRQKRAAM